MDHVITTREAAEIIGCTREHASYLCKHEIIRAKKFGTVWQIDRRSAERYAKTPQECGRPRGVGNS